MRPFDYLLIFISVIVGLGVTEIVAGIGNMLKHRDTVSMYWVQTCWAVTLFLFYLQIWYRAWTYRNLDAEGMTFGAFLLAIITPVSLYLAAELLFPEITAASTTDLEEHFFAHRAWIFSLFVVPVLMASIHGTVFKKQPLLWWPNLFRGVAVVVLAIAGATANRVYHALAAAATLLLLIGFILYLRYSMPNGARMVPDSGTS